MPIFGAELSEVAPKDPVSLAVVDDQYIVAFNRNSSTSGLMPDGAFSVMDTATETARAFSGLPTQYWTVVPAAAAVGAGGYAWAAISYGHTVWKVDPVTGGVTTITTGSGFINNGAARVATAGGYVVLISTAGSSNGVRTINVSTNATAQYSITGHTFSSAVASDGTYVYFYGMVSSVAGLYRLDPSTGTATAVGGRGSGAPDGQGCYVGGSIWMSNTVSLFKFDPTGVAAPVAYNHTAITGGNYLDPVSLAAHTDGWIYGYGGSGYLIGFNPATGTFGKEALSPARGRRFNVVSCDGKLWVPSGEPLT